MRTICTIRYADAVRRAMGAFLSGKGILNPFSSKIHSAINHMTSQQKEDEKLKRWHKLSVGKRFSLYKTNGCK